MSWKSKRNSKPDDGLKVVSIPVKVTMLPPGPVQRLFAEALHAQQAGKLDEAQKPATARLLLTHAARRCAQR